MSLHEEFLDIEARVKFLEKRLEQIAKTHDDCKRIMQIPGIGILTATLLIAHVGKVYSLSKRKMLVSHSS